MKRIILIVLVGVVGAVSLTALPSDGAKQAASTPTCGYFKTPQTISPDFADGQLFKATWSLQEVKDESGNIVAPSACANFTYSLYLLRTRPDTEGATAPPEVMGYSEQRGDGIHNQVRFAVRLAEPVTSVCAYVVSRDSSGAIIDELPHDPLNNEDVPMCVTHAAGSIGSGGTSYN